MDNTKKKKRETTEKLYFIIGLVTGVIAFGIFAALMVIAIKSSGEDTILQMKFTIPAWIFVGALAFAGLAISLSLISFMEHSFKSRAHEKRLKAIETRLDMLLKGLDKNRELLRDTKDEVELSLNLGTSFADTVLRKMKNEEHKQSCDNQDDIPDVASLVRLKTPRDREALPYEQLDDFLDGFVGMSDTEMEDTVKQLIGDEYEIVKKNRNGIKQVEETEEEDIPQIIEFQTEKKCKRRRKKMARQEKKR